MYLFASLTPGSRRISDDGFWHSLIVYKDVLTGGIRLHAAVWEGELRSCPVWTAFGSCNQPRTATRPVALQNHPCFSPLFSNKGSTNDACATVTHQSSSPTWLKRVSRRRIRLADIQLYVFCQNYRQQTQRRGNAGAFEISFHSEECKYSLLFPIVSPNLPPSGSSQEKKSNLPSNTEYLSQQHATASRTSSLAS